jgi:hypothetical protein
MITQMFAQIGSNDLLSFKRYLENHYDEVDHTISAIRYNYGIQPRIYVEDARQNILQANPATLFAKLMGNSLMASYMATDVFYEMIETTQDKRSFVGEFLTDFQEILSELSC